MSVRNLQTLSVPWEGLVFAGLWRDHLTGEGETPSGQAARTAALQHRRYTISGACPQDWEFCLELVALPGIEPGFED
jgi:hypothetical protein